MAGTADEAGKWSPALGELHMGRSPLMGLLQGPALSTEVGLEPALGDLTNLNEGNWGLDRQPFQQRS